MLERVRKGRTQVHRSSTYHWVLGSRSTVIADGNRLFTNVDGRVAAEYLDENPRFSGRTYHPGTLRSSNRGRVPQDRDQGTFAAFCWRRQQGAAKPPPRGPAIAAPSSIRRPTPRNSRASRTSYSRINWTASGTTSPMTLCSGLLGSSVNGPEFASPSLSGSQTSEPEG